MKSRVLNRLAIFSICISGCVVPPKTTTTPTTQGDEVNQATPWKDAPTLKTYCDSIIVDVKAKRAALMIAGTPATVEGRLKPFNELEMGLDTAQGWASMAFSMHPDKGVRKAAQDCRQQLSELANELSQDRALYDALAGVDVSTADAQTQRYSKHTLRSFKRAGVDKNPDTRKRLAKIHAEMTRLSAEFRKRLLDDVRHIEVKDAAKLKGLPKDWLSAHKPDANGVIKITTDYPDFIPFQTYCEDEALRKELYVAFLSRGYPENGKTLKTMLALRHEYANLLGHKTWASYNAADKMVKTSDTIDKFVSELATTVKPLAEADLKQLLAYKKKDISTATSVQTHDRFFYTSKVRE